MPAWGESLIGLVCLVGIIGTIVPALPGSLLIGGGILVWAVVERSATSWVVALLAIGVLAVGQVLTYLIPGRRMSAAGVPNRTLLIGAVVGIIGFFVIPVIGLPLGFVAGVYGAERVRLDTHDAAWPSTVEALKGAGLSMLISLAAALVASGMWLTAAITT